jgi:hypothetical protein
MKKTFYLLLFTCLLVKVSAQSVSPGTTTEFDPLTNYVLQFTFPSGDAATDYYISQVQADKKGCSITPLSTSGEATVNFTDKTEVHSFKLIRNGNNATTVFTFTKIRTLDGLKPTWTPSNPPGINPVPPYDDVLPIPVCAPGTFTYTAPAVKYKDASGNEYGIPMNSSEWLVPKNWKVNSTVSDGVTPIVASSQTADITFDPITGGLEEIKYRARNNQSPPTLKRSDYYRILIDREKIQLQANGQNPVSVSCAENTTTRTFVLNNLSFYFGACVNPTYTWNLGAVPNGWLYNGSPAPASVVTTTPSIDLAYAGTLTAPSTVSVTFTHTNGTPYTFTAPINYTACTSSIFSAPLGIQAVCGVQTPTTLTVTTNGNLTEITGYAWSFGAVPNKWNDINGVAMPATMATSTNSATVVSDGSTTGPPSDISVTPLFNGTPGPFTYNIPVTYRNCCENPPTNPTPSFSGSNGYVILNWDPVVAATNYTVEYMTLSGGNNQILSTSATTLNYYGPAYEDAKFRVKATCSNGITSDWTPWKAFPANADCALNPLSIGYSLLGNKNVQINWSAVPGALRYNVKLEPYGSTPPGTATVNGVTTTSTILTAPYANGAYYTISVQPECFYASTYPAQWIQMGTPASIYYRSSGSSPATPVVIQINEDVKEGSKKITISPNPANNIINLEFNSNEGGLANIILFEMSGKKVMEQNVAINKGVNKRDLNISTIKGGMYYVTVHLKEGNIAAPFVKQ